MRCLPVRLAFWFAALIVFPIPAALVPLSFRVEVLQRITLDALPQERGSDREVGERLTGRVLARLERAEKTEVDPWYRDDIRIAWITAYWSQHGIPSWSLHSNQSPFVAATWQVLHCHPDQVWPHIVAAREAKLGKVRPMVWGGVSSPRKPVRSVGIAELERRRIERQQDRAA